MLKVHVWLPSGNMVGHTSISFGTNYVSFWPENESGKKDLKVKRSHPGQFLDDLRSDIASEGGRSPITVSIPGADKEALENFVLELQRRTPRYQLARYNCSSVVAECLNVACKSEPSFQPSAADYGRLAKFLGSGIWTPHEVLRYARELAAEAIDA